MNKLNKRRVKSPMCRICQTEDPEDFRPSNKSLCKGCISCYQKIDRGTAKKDDPIIIKFCEDAEISLDTLYMKEEPMNFEKEIKSLMIGLLNIDEMFEIFINEKKASDTERKGVDETITLLKTKIDDTIKENIELTKRVEELENKSRDDIANLKEQIEKLKPIVDVVVEIKKSPKKTLPARKLKK